MATRDAEEFGTIVDGLVGHGCERSLATNSIKSGSTPKSTRGGFDISGSSLPGNSSIATR